MVFTHWYFILIHKHCRKKLRTDCRDFWRLFLEWPMINDLYHQIMLMFLFSTDSQEWRYRQWPFILGKKSINQILRLIVNTWRKVFRKWFFFGSLKCVVPFVDFKKYSEISLVKMITSSIWCVVQLQCYTLTHTT